MTSDLLEITKDDRDCPYSKNDVNEYLDLEDYDRRRETLDFQFRANCTDRTYWVWSYRDQKNELCHVVLTERSATGEIVVGCGVFNNAAAEDKKLVAEMIEKNV